MNNNPWAEIKSSLTETHVNGILADKNNILEFYWAKDIRENLLFVLSATSEILLSIKLPKLHGIELKIVQNKDNKQIVFLLKDKESKDIFYKLCKDLIVSARSANTQEHAINLVLRRLEKWQKFLRKSSKTIDKRQLKGLIGELIFLRDYLLKNYSSDDSLSFWKAPLDSVHDFELEDMTIEVKTKSSVNSMHISSYEQLFSELPFLYLYVLTLTESNSNNKKSFNISELIEEIKGMISDLESNEKFEDLLIQYGYFGIEEYDELNFLVSSDEFYLVEDGFPRIELLPEGIENLTFRVNLEKCKEYITDRKIIFNKDKQ